MMKQRHAARVGNVRALGLLLLVMNGCGAQQCQGSAAPGDTARSAAVAGSALPAAPAAIPPGASPPAPTVALAPSGGEGSDAAAEQGSASADEGSGIPPGMPDEGSPAYQRLVDRLCEELAPEIWAMGQSAMHSCMVGGGEDGAPRTVEAHQFCGNCNEGCFTTWTEQPDGSWKETENGERGWVLNETRSLRSDVENTVRYATQAQIVAARAEITTQHIDIPSATAGTERGYSEGWHEFVDLNHDGQTEIIVWIWHSTPCGVFDPTVYLRGADGRWVQDPDARNTYFEQADYE